MLDDSILKIREEFEKAIRKHSNFCDKFTQMNLFHARYEEATCKKRNSEGPFFADRILEEEIAEARVAYLQGDKNHCLEELAQCGAVVLRMMDFVDSKMK